MQPLTTYLNETRSGNTNAFNEVVLRFREQALWKAYRTLGNYQLAEEVVQEAFLCAFKNLSSLQQPNRFPGWFQSILLSCISRAFREHGCYHYRLNPDELPSPESIPPIDCDGLDYRELHTLIHRAVAQLPEKTREVCSHYYYFGHSLKEISGSLGIPIGTVKRKLHEAREQIRETVICEHSFHGLRVGYMPITDHLLAMVSHQINRHDDLIIDLRKFISWSALVESVRYGLIDVAFIMAPLALNLFIEGVPIQYILDAAHGGSAITVHNAIASTKALSGATLGLPMAGSTHHVLLHYFLENESIPVRSGVSTTYLSPSYNIGALKNHQIDGFFCAEPWNTRAVHEGIGHILIRSNQIDPDHLCCIIVANRDFATWKGEILHEYMKLLLAAQKLIARQPDRCADIQSRYSGIQPSITREVLREGQVSFADLMPNRSKIERVMNMALNAGIIQTRCNLERFIHHEAI